MPQGTRRVPLCPGGAQVEARWHETLAERGTAFIGKPHFLVVHGIWFFIWIAINTGVIAVVHKFDDYPFGFWDHSRAEAIIISGFVLISQNRQNAHSSKRAELDYEVSVRTYRDINGIEAKLDG